VGALRISGGLLSKSQSIVHAPLRQQRADSSMARPLAVLRSRGTNRS
jgi:hypothetical protein